MQYMVIKIWLLHVTRWTISGFEFHWTRTTLSNIYHLEMLQSEMDSHNLLPLCAFWLTTRQHVCYGSEQYLYRKLAAYSINFRIKAVVNIWSVQLYKMNLPLISNLLIFRMVIFLLIGSILFFAFYSSTLRVLINWWMCDWRNGEWFEMRSYCNSK